MIFTHQDKIPLDIVNWFKQDMSMRMDLGRYETRYFNEGIPVHDIYGENDPDRIQEYRIKLELGDTAYTRLQQYVYQIIPRTQWFYAAYQRQFFPHALHADYLPPDADLTYAYSMIVPLDPNPNNIFKTLVWNQILITDDDIRNLITDYSSNPTKYPKIYKNSEQYDLEHVSWYAGSIIDSVELLGTYTYELGSIGQFSRNLMHCSSNWRKYKTVTYKDFIIIHAN